MSGRLSAALKNNWFSIGMAAVILLVWGLYALPVVEIAKVEGALRAIMAPGIFVVFFFNGLSFKIGESLEALKRPWAAIGGTLIIYALSPLAIITVFAGAFPGPDEAGLRIGALIIAAAPTTMISGIVMSKLSGGDETAAILLVFITSLIFPVVAPIIFVLGTNDAVEVVIEFLPALRDLFVRVVLPMMIGVVAEKVSKGRLKPARKFFGPLGQVFILLMVFGCMLSAWPKLVENGMLVVKVVLVVLAVKCALRWGLLLLLPRVGFRRREAATLAVLGTEKSLPPSIVIHETYFMTAYPVAIVIPLIYHAVQLIVDGAAAGRTAVWTGRLTDAAPDGASGGDAIPEK